MDAETFLIFNAHVSLINLVICYINYRAQHYMSYERSFWVRNIFKKRRELGYQQNLVKELREEDQMNHFRYFRMSKELFDKLLTIVELRISKQNTRFRAAIPAAERLSLTLRFLASGDMQTSLSFAYRISKTAVSNIIKETCEALWNSLQPLYLNMPSTPDEFEKVAKVFEERWNLPHCVGAIDGKHIIIDCPPKSGSKYHNYKGSFSTVLLAVCDGEYRYQMVDIGAYGSQSDGGIFSTSNFGCKLKTGKLSLPQNQDLPNSNLSFPYFYVGDEAFPLLRNMMRPYPGSKLTFERRIFNYRLSRARRIIENTFGIMVARWRIFRKPIKGKPENVDNIVKAAVCLHNFLITEELEKEKRDPNYVTQYNHKKLADHVDKSGKEDQTNGRWRIICSQNEALQDFDMGHINRSGVAAACHRDALANYLRHEGKVSWQEEYVLRC